VCSSTHISESGDTEREEEGTKKKKHYPEVERRGKHRGIMVFEKKHYAEFEGRGQAWWDNFFKKKHYAEVEGRDKHRGIGRCLWQRLSHQLFDEGR
jgi:hypothetical protein